MKKLAIVGLKFNNFCNNVSLSIDEKESKVCHIPHRNLHGMCCLIELVQ